jgi:hypothetical protein
VSLVCDNKAGAQKLVTPRSLVSLGLTADGVSTINFDIVVCTRRGAVYVGCFVHLERVDGAEVSGANPSSRLKMSILAAHQMLGHKSEEQSTRRTAKALGITIMRGSIPVCEACALSKA